MGDQLPLWSRIIWIVDGLGIFAYIAGFFFFCFLYYGVEAIKNMFTRRTKQ